MNPFCKNAVRILFIAALAITGMLISTAPMTVASTTLKTATTADKTASVGLPTGWKLAKGLNGFVLITGPNSSDEQINLGTIVIAKNASSGSTTHGEVLFALPFSASLKDKFTTIFQAAATKQGLPQPQITFANQVQTKLPMCSLFSGSMNAGAKSLKFESVLCSLQPDVLGLYKNLVFYAEVPSSLAAKDRPIVEQIVQSYRVTPDMFNKMIAAYTKPPPLPAGAAMPVRGGLAPYENPSFQADCFDYNVIRESPPWEMPMHCGGWQPG